MSKNCANCNYLNDDQSKFCQECGMSLTQPATAETSQTDSVEPPAPVTEAQQTPLKEAAVQTAAAVQPQTSPQKKREKQQLSVEESGQPISVGTYFIMMLLFSVPLINIVMMLVWAIGSKNKNKRNFAAAAIIWFILAILLCFIGSIVVGFILSWSAGVMEGKEQDIFRYFQMWQQMNK